MEVLKKYSIDLSNVDISIIDFSDIKDDIDYDIIAKKCQDKVLIHPEWGTLAGRLKLLSLKKNTGRTFSDTTMLCKELLNQEYYHFVMKNKWLDNIIRDDRDLNFNFFGISTAITSYLLKCHGIVRETPQQMFLRVAVWLWMSHSKMCETECIYRDRIISTYDNLSLFNYMHATPTLFNSGTRRPQLSSCFLMTIDDSMESICEAWRHMALISKNSGGLGIDISNIRHSEINNSSVCKGIVPLIQTIEKILLYVDQGNKRKGAGAIYLPDYHKDILMFLELKKSNGSESVRARELFYGLWISDLFMKRVENDELWSLFCPNIAKGLNDVWGSEFERLYLTYEHQEKFDKQVKARDIWLAIYDSAIKTGVPYILFKDACNRKSNQKNLGTIRCSNLCTEIIQYTSTNEIASCNLGNIVLHSCITKSSCITMKDDKSTFDFEKLGMLTRELVLNINRVIDINYYIPDIPQIEYSNLRHRPMAIGVQGLADVFAIMDYCWDSKEAFELNKKIFETIYFNAISQSIEISKKRYLAYNDNNFKELVRDIYSKTSSKDKINITYPSFDGSPASKGLFQFDMWAIEKFCKDNPKYNYNEVEYNFNSFKHRLDYSFLSGMYDWETLRKELIKYGQYNSLLTSVMPTASTAHLIGNNECIEPFTGLIFSRKVLSGQYALVNKYLVKDLQKINLWNDDIMKRIISYKSLNFLDATYLKDSTNSERLKHIKNKYLTVYEMPNYITTQMSIERGPFICQSQSFNIFTSDPNYQTFTKLLFYQWKNGAKTGMYYLRTKPEVSPNDVINIVNKSKEDEVVDKTVNKIVNTGEVNKIVNKICTDEVCMACQ